MTNKILKLVPVFLFLMLTNYAYNQSNWQVFAPDGSYFYKTCDYIRYVGEDLFNYERGQKNWRICNNRGMDIAPFGIEIWNTDRFNNGMTPAYIINNGKEERVVIDKFGQIVTPSLQITFNRPIWLYKHFNGYKEGLAMAVETVPDLSGHWVSYVNKKNEIVVPRKYKMNGWYLKSVINGSSCKGAIDVAKLNPIIDEKISGFEMFKIEYRKANKRPSVLEILLKGFEIAVKNY